MRVVRWALLLFSVYVLVAVVRFYALHPEHLFQWDRMGVLRLGGTCILALGCYMLVVAIARERGSRPVSKHGEGRLVEDDSRPDHNHPFSTAFRRHPTAFVLVVCFLFSIPFLLPLGARWSSEASDVAYWRATLVGEVVAGMVFAIAWYRTGRRRARSEGP